jgi:hypothetical protein
MKKLISKLLPLEVILAATLSIAGTNEPYSQITNSNEEQSNRTAYLNQVVRELPIARLMIEKGIIKGVIYEPKKEDLEKLRSLEDNPITNESLIENFKKRFYENDLDNSGATLISYKTNNIPNKSPSYLVFFEKIFTDPAVRNEEDLKSVIIHELNHAKDMYFGIDIPDGKSNTNFKITNSNLINNLLELRAYHRQLKMLFKEGKLKEKISQNHIGRVIQEYIAVHTVLEEQYKKEATEDEKEIIDYQFKKFKDIVISEDKKGIDILIK